MSSEQDNKAELASLLGDMRALDIRVQLDGDSLRVRGNKERLAPELKSRIQALRGELIVFLRAAEDIGNASETIPRRAPGTPVPLSFLQQNLWLIDQLEGSVHYNMAVALRLEGELDVAALYAALRDIVARHESLRTVFRADDDGRPMQWVRDDISLALSSTDLRSLAEEARDGEVLRRANEEARRPFDLANDLMMRTHLLQLADDRFVLLLTKHHIASDGWSMDVLLDDLSRLYEAHRLGQPDPLPPLPVQYADYALWLARWMRGDVLQSKLDYWTKRLAELPTTHSIPLDSPRGRHRTIAGGHHERRLSLQRYDQLLTLCNQHNVTLFMMLEAAFAVFLSRWSGERDIAIGTPISSRGRPELTNLIGYFTNTLVLRSDCDDNLSFVEFLGATRTMMLEAHQHHHIPFEMLVDRLNPERSLAHNALIQITFALQNNRASTMGTLQLPELSLSTLRNDEHAAVKFDLELTVKEDADGLLAKWNFNTDIFTRATIERMDRHFEVLLDGIATEPSRPLWQLPIIPDAERAVVARWNDTAVDFPGGDTLPGMLAAQALATPDRIALCFEEERLTYSELDARANRLAHELVEQHGVDVGTPVGLCFDRSIDLIVAMTAILKAGGAYVALDPSLPEERLAYMVADSGARLVLAQDGVGAALATAAGVTVRGVAAPPGGPVWSSAPLLQRAHPQSLAYVIYTSGSTGRPKGTLTPHRGVCNRLHAMQAQFCLGDGDRVLQKTPIGFDVSVWELFWPLATGATLVLARPEGHKDPRYIAQAIVAHGITTVHFVPSMLQVFMPVARETPLPTLRYLMTSGEALSFELQAQCVEVFGHASLVNQYGPTETAIEVTWWPFDEPRADHCVPIGRPIANNRMHVLDAHDRPVPIGVAGQLHIAGVQVGNGYIGNPGLTAEKFLTLDIDGVPERVYRTGDRARWLGDGVIEYLGRLDNQVKLRGLRIELGEIEACLLETGSVAQAAVLVCAFGDGGPEGLVAYVVPHGGSGDSQALKTALRAQLPEYMVPSRFLFLAAMPLTSSGKLDRKALPAPAAGTAADVEAVPLTAADQALAALWGTVLGAAPADAMANFFGLGGHSLLAMQLVSLMRRRFGIEVPLKVIFEKPVLCDQSRWLSEQQAGIVLPPIERRPEGALELSFAQQRLWLLAQLDRDGTAYNIPRAMHLDGELDVDALAQAFGDVVERHINLRLCFPGVDGSPSVRVLERFQPMVQVDLRGLDAHAQQREVQRLCDAHAAHRHDLGRGPLLKVTLLALAPRRHALLVNMHHIVSDGWSIGVLMRDVGALYAARRGESASALPTLDVQYPDFAAWQRRWLSGDVLSRQLAYWRDALAGAPALLALPVDRPRPERFSYRGTQLWRPLPAALRPGLQALGQRHGSTMFMTVLAAFKLLLARRSGQLDICVGTPVANRAHHQTEDLVGFFVNTLVLRTRLAPGQTFAELLAAVRERALDAYGNQDVPFDQVVEDIRPPRSLAHSPLFQVMFRLDSVTRGATVPGLEIAEIVRAGATTQFDLTLTVIDDDGHLTCEWGYATDLFDETTIVAMHGELEALLQDVVVQGAHTRPVLGAMAPPAARVVADAAPATPFEAPVGATECELAHTWESLLHVERVSRHDNFFDLGGHSLMAVKLVSGIAQRFGVELPLSAVFAAPTLAALAGQVSTMRDGDN